MRGLLLAAASTVLVSACSNDSSPPHRDGNAGTSGGGQSGSSMNGGGAHAGSSATHAGSATGGNPQGGFSGTYPGTAGGGGATQGGKTGHAGSAGAGTSSMDGGAAGAGGEPPNGGTDGTTAGAGPDCETTPVAQPPAASCAVAPDVTQEYKVGLATEVLSFGVRLRATGYFGAVHINEIEVHYYYSQEETSGFQPSVDSFILQPGGVDLTASSEISIVALDPKQSSSSGPGCQTHFVRIRNSSPIELPSGVQPYAEVHVTLTPKNPAPPNQNHADDHSYVPEAKDWTETSLLGVFHCGQLTSGCTPGDGGTCN